MLKLFFAPGRTGGCLLRLKASKQKKPQGQSLNTDHPWGFFYSSLIFFYIPRIVTKKYLQIKFPAYP